MTSLRANYLHPEVFTIPGFLDASECERLVADSDATSYEEATVSTGFGGVVAQNVRNNGYPDFRMETRLGVSA